MVTGLGISESSTPRTVTRHDLYEQVWTTPMRTLAGEYGVSDVWLANICRRLDVPRPGLGYWARIQHGHKPRRIPLPPRKELPEKATITATPDRPATAGAPPASRPVPPDVPVAEDLANPHPAVRTLRKALRESRVFDGVLSLVGKDQTLIRVSPSTRDRALRILDGLFRGLLARGHGVVAKTDVGRYGAACSLEAVIGGMSIEITLKERVTRADHVPRKGEDRFRAARYDFTPTNRLTLRVGQLYGDSHQSWADGAKRPLEGKLGQAILGIEQVARHQAEIDRQREERRRLEERWQREQAIAELREQHERELGKDLTAMADAWREARQLRAFLGALEEGTPAELKTDGFFVWLRWAHGYAERLDPLTTPKTIPKVIEPHIPKELGEAARLELRPCG